MTIPRLKSLDCVANDGSLLISLDPRTRLELADPTGQLRALLVLLRDGTRSPAELCGALCERWPQTTLSEVDAAVSELDQLGWLENAHPEPRLTDYDRERYFSNLAFFDAFTTLGRSREDIQLELLESRVVVLGVGGLGSSVVQNLAGLGVSHLKLLDFDTVALRNFARQFTYAEARVGHSKVHEVARWLSEFDSRITVEVADMRITCADDVRRVASGADLVVSAVDDPEEIDLWVNEACVSAGVPFIRGGLAYMQGLYWSVDPGRSACRQCLETHRMDLANGFDRPVVTWERVLRSARVNRAIGPVAQLLGALVSMEALRYLTRVHPPVSAGCYRLVDFSGDGAMSSDPWPSDPNCPVCAASPRR